MHRNGKPYMKNQDSWTPSKYVFKNGKLRASRNPKEVSIGSRFLTDLVAARYDACLKQYARGHLIDLGCGKAPLYGAYKDLVTEVTCADWENTLHKNKYLDLNCDLTKPLPLESGVYDTIILSSVLEHIPEPALLWAELERILAPDGVILLNVPFFYWIHEAPYDFYRYTEFALRRFAEQAGLEVVELKPTGGSPEVLTDILAKNLMHAPLVGRTLSTALQKVAAFVLKTSPGKRVSTKTARLFPLGYFLVARKSASGTGEER